MIGLLWLGSCVTEGVLFTPDPGWERMLVQPKVDVYERPEALPAGVVTFRPVAADPVIATGSAGGPPVARIPYDVTPAMVARGQDRFDTFCAPCHGATGDADTPVAALMPLKPRDLLSDYVRQLPDGALFRTIREGYGVMPSYARRVPVDDAWAVVAWVRVLEAASRTRLDDLPDDLRERALRELP